MKCKKCNFKSNYIEDFSAHYRLRHPNHKRVKTERTVKALKTNLSVERGFTKMERAIMKKLLRKLEATL